MQDKRDQELIERGRIEERERFKKMLGNVFWRAVVPVCLSLATVLITKWVGV